MFYNSSTVPIGGAPFVPPSLALQDAVFYGDSSSSASSSRSSSISYPPSSSNSEANLGSAHSYGMSSSPSTSSSMQSDYSLSPRQIAAREYARRLHDHTPAPPALAAAAVVEPPKERSRAMDVLLGKSPPPLRPIPLASADHALTSPPTLARPTITTTHPSFLKCTLFSMPLSHRPQYSCLYVIITSPQLHLPAWL
ncbi:hypothetical protein BCV69DRAFT_200167 [Microstroma glucosiphilum]|uniref:Uncharacterized protein n=1 Tax=Pseudomicrostroma glucosiphilum TaxID=1684307 RepID=A0A316UCQ3_9BASI|nr:hypothetical protein BCV69DRAFT_200167 [Pseudomicrostroma glucosiphilum]PWN20815.1 hypothetical protein BCV69DRAFT_200167 [Pseudomicrostroma glucosiphilum]